MSCGHSESNTILQTLFCLASSCDERTYRQTDGKTEKERERPQAKRAISRVPEACVNADTITAFQSPDAAPLRALSGVHTPHCRDTRKWSDDYRTRTRTSGVLKNSRPARHTGNSPYQPNSAHGTSNLHAMNQLAPTMDNSPQGYCQVTLQASELSGVFCVKSCIGCFCIKHHQH